MEKKRNIIEWAMHYRQIVVFITAVLVAFGVFALDRMNKNEFRPKGDCPWRADAAA